MTNLYNLETLQDVVVREEYPVSIVLSGRHFRRIIIDPHYKEKHPELTDLLIVKLVRQLAGEDFMITDRKGIYRYFRAEPVLHAGKPYRLVMVTAENDDFIGVVNAFRVKKKRST